jgi:hypothetical protein
LGEFPPLTKASTKIKVWGEYFAPHPYKYMDNINLMINQLDISEDIENSYSSIDIEYNSMETMDKLFAFAGLLLMLGTLLILLATLQVR